MKIVWSFLLINAVFVGVNAGLNYTMIYTFGLGFKGSPIATAIREGHIICIFTCKNLFNSTPIINFLNGIKLYIKNLKKKEKVF